MIPCLSRCTFVVESAADMLASQEAVYLPKLSFGERLPSTSEGNPGAAPLSPGALSRAARVAFAQTPPAQRCWHGMSEFHR